MFAPSIPPSVNADDFANAVALLRAASSPDTVKDHLAQLEAKVTEANAAQAAAQAAQQAAAEARTKAEGIVATAREIEERSTALDAREAALGVRERTVSVREAELEARAAARIVELDEQIGARQKTLDGITAQLSALRERL
jgi:hypothetical protein